MNVCAHADTVCVCVCVHLCLWVHVSVCGVWQHALIQSVAYMHDPYAFQCGRELLSNIYFTAHFLIDDVFSRCFATCPSATVILPPSLKTSIYWFPSNTPRPSNTLPPSTFLNHTNAFKCIYPLSAFAP